MKKLFLFLALVIFWSGSINQIFAINTLDPNKVSLVTLYDHDGLEVKMLSTFYKLQNEYYFFGSNDKYGDELFLFNPVDSSAKLVKDFNPGEGDTFVDLAENNGEVYAIVAVKSGEEVSKTRYENQLYQIRKGGNLNLMSSFNSEYNSISFRQADESILFLNVYLINNYNTSSVTNTRKVYQLIDGNLKFLQDGLIQPISRDFKYFIKSPEGKIAIRIYNEKDKTDKVIQYNKSGIIELVYPNYASGYEFQTIYFNGELYFNYLDPLYGYELHKLTTSGPKLVVDINKGNLNADIKIMQVYQNNLFILANDGSTGQELWRIDANGNAFQVIDGTPYKSSSYNSHFSTNCLLNMTSDQGFILGEYYYFFVRENLNVADIPSYLYRVDKNFKSELLIDLTSIYSRYNLLGLYQISSKAIFFDIQDKESYGSGVTRVLINSDGNIEKRLQSGYSASELSDGFKFGGELFYKIYDSGCSSRLLLQKNGTIDATGLITDGLASSEKFEDFYYFKTFGNYIVFERRTVIHPLQTEWVLLKQVDFTDVTRDGTFAKYIYGLKDANLIGGFNDLTFRPQKSITRGEFATMVVNSFGLSKAFINNPFTDLNSGVAHYDTIMSLYNMGVINGYSDGTFKPNENITRGQAAKIIANLIDVNYSTSALGFTDIDKSSMFYNQIMKLTGIKVDGEKIMSGYSDGSFKVNENITREQAAKIIYLGSRVN